MARLSPWSLAHVGWAERWGCFLLCGAMGLDTLKTVWQGQGVPVGGQLGVMAACLGGWSRCKRWDVTQRAGCPSAHDAIHPVHATFHPEYGVALHGLVTHLAMPLEPGDVFPMALIPVPKNDEE